MRRKVVEVEPEPEYEAVELAEGEEAEAPLTLVVAAKCHYASVECEPTALSTDPYVVQF